MRLDIPHEEPRRREGDDIAPGADDTRLPVRRAPDNPIRNHLPREDEQRPGREPVERRRREPGQDMPR